MKINVQANVPAAKAGQLTAVIDLGESRPLFDDATARQHPAWADLERRRGQEELKAAYLAVGAAPLLYLPAADAKYWDDDEKIRVLAARAFDAAAERQAETLVLLLDGPDGAAAAALAAEGIALRAYRFDKYKGEANGQAAAGRPGKAAKANGKKEPAIIFVVTAAGQNAAREAVAQRLALVDSVNRARDLINEPGSVANPAEIESRARAVAKEYNLQITVLDDKQLAREGYEGLLTVGRGGAVPPRMIVLNYDGTNAAKAGRTGAKKTAGKSAGKGAATAKARGRARGAATAAEGNTLHLGLLGKGITFDSGGYCIKPSNKMWEMKGDMSGAAAVRYTLESIARERLPLRVTGVMVLAQNYVDARATVPGDIFRARNGKTVHVDNTDAEGRLILIDGLSRLGEEGVTHLVDVATLTGACVRALGTSLSGVLGNDGFADEVAAVAGAQGEPCWRLPMVDEYMEWLKTDLADINNITANGLAGTTIGALFLREFLPEGVHWAHLDIAGTFLVENNWKYYRPGATGVMVRTMYALAERLAQQG